MVREAVWWANGEYVRSTEEHMGSENRTHRAKGWKTRYGFDIKDSEILREAARLCRHMDDEGERACNALADKFERDGR